jgi:hypothetical protein
LISGEIKEGKSCEGFTMKCEVLNEQFVGIFDFIKREKISGVEVIHEHGKEFFVEYNSNGVVKETSKKRTFEGIRLMIIGNT